MSLYQLVRLLCLRRELQSHSRWTRQRLEQHQAKALKDLRQYAYARSPFYSRFHRGLENAPVNHLPVLTKADLMRHWDEVVTDRTVKLDDVQAYLERLGAGRPANRFRKRYYAVSTSGSTGLRGIFIYSPQEWTAVLASYSRAGDWAGLKPWMDRRLRIAVAATTTPWHQSALVSATLDNWFLPVLSLDSTEPVEEVTARLERFQPHLLAGYANTVRLLAGEQTGGRLTISPEAVFCAAEVLTDNSRRLINKAWGVEPYNIYGATETAGIASECYEHKGLHIYEDLVMVEVVDHNYRPVGPGRYGAKLLVTVLFSRTLPLIRYEMSDSVQLSRNHCTCHCPFAQIADVQGRIEDVVYMAGSDGRVVPVQPNVFHDVLGLFPVGGWQVVQERADAVKVLVMSPGPAFDETELAEAVKARLEKLGANAPSVAVNCVNSLERGALGKTYLVKSMQQEEAVMRMRRQRR